MNAKLICRCKIGTQKHVALQVTRATAIIRAAVVLGFVLFMMCHFYSQNYGRLEWRSVFGYTLIISEQIMLKHIKYCIREFLHTNR